MVVSFLCAAGRWCCEHPSLAAMIVVCALATGAGLPGAKRSPLGFLPGTQIGTVDSAADQRSCILCHATLYADRPVTIHSDWAGSMMAQAARDPIFYAALAAANKDMTSSGEYCLRCHSPMGWLAGRSEDFTGSSIRGTDLDGVQCDYCHRAGDPLHPDTTIPISPGFPVPGYGDGMHAVQRSTFPRRGPFDTTTAPHPTLYDPFQISGELCGVCHDVSNPNYAADRAHQPPYAFGPVERTYSEWLMSWYSTQGAAGTCQSCHMRDTAGYACSISGPLRAHLATHDLTGGNAFVPDILPAFWDSLDTGALAAAKQRAIATLRRAADLLLETSRAGDSAHVLVRIINKTGHKLPTGYPEGRRMWLSIVGTDINGDTVFASGRYDADSARLIPDDQLKVYRLVPGLTDSTASLHGLAPGASFHFILNDTILLDNRIPPRGFTNAGFAGRLAAPIGVAYADSQYWDDTRYLLPSGVSTVTASLYYQTISREYADFLRDENAGNPYDWNSWGSKLHDAWQLRGMSAPVLMNSATLPVADTATSVHGSGRPAVPVRAELFQNYPNPFNPSTTVSFILPHSSRVSLTVIDLTGRTVMRLVDGMRSAGAYSVRFDGTNLPSGVYLCSLTTQSDHLVRKMLLIR